MIQRLPVALLWLLGSTTCTHAFHSSTPGYQSRSHTKLSVAFAASATTLDDFVQDNLQEDHPLVLTHKIISNLKYRQLKAELVKHGCSDASGTTAQLRTKLREIVFPGEQCAIIDGVEECGPDISVSIRIKRGTDTSRRKYSNSTFPSYFDFHSRPCKRSTSISRTNRIPCKH
jgi:hypothetical protein